MLELGFGPGGLTAVVVMVPEKAKDRLVVSNSEPDGNTGGPERRVVAAVTTGRRNGHLEFVRGLFLLGRFPLGIGLRHRDRLVISQGGSVPRRSWTWRRGGTYQLWGVV